MDMETWRKLLGKSLDDTAVKAALDAAGVKKAPKLAKDDVTVIVDLKGHGMWLEMVDEAWLKKLNDQDVGEGPLILTNVGAYVRRRKSKDVYKGTLPFTLSADMIQADVRKALGPPTSKGEDFDRWLLKDVEITAGYSEEVKLDHVILQVLGRR